MSQSKITEELQIKIGSYSGGIKIEAVIEATVNSKNSKNSKSCVSQLRERIKELGVSVENTFGPYGRRKVHFVVRATRRQLEDVAQIDLIDRIGSELNLMIRDYENPMKPKKPKKLRFSCFRL